MSRQLGKATVVNGEVLVLTNISLETRFGDATIDCSFRVYDPIKDGPIDRDLYPPTSRPLLGDRS